MIININNLDSWMSKILPESLYKTYPLFYILFFVMSFFVLMAIAIPVFTVLYNTIRTRRNKRKASIEECYKIALFNYLRANTEELPKLEKGKGGVEKKVLLNLIFQLIHYVSGTDRKRLEKLFDALELETFIIQKLKSPFCIRKASYLKKLSSITSSNIPIGLLRKFTYSKFVGRRLYAMQSLIAMKPELIEPLFKEYRYTLSFWEQINYYDFFVSREIPVPDFRCLASTKNTSVLIFAIRMIRMFQQRKGSVDSYKLALKNPDPNVQIEIYKTLAEFGYQNIDDLLPDLKMVNNPYLQQHIITFMAKAKSATTSLLMDYYNKNRSPEMQLHILYCIYNFVHNGKEDVERFALQNEDIPLRNLSKHLINNVL